MNDFDASAAIRGFQFQLSWALLELYQQTKDDESIRVSIEVFDDVAVEDDQGRPLKAVQLKHHAAPAALTDASVDIWKTLRVWLATPSLREAGGPRLFLITTGDAAPGSAAELLGESGRDPEQAAALLTAAANAHKAEATRAGRDLWRDAPQSERLELLSRIRVVTGSTSLDNIETLLRREWSVFVHPQHMDAFAERILGWWNRQCIAVIGADHEHPRFVSGTQLATKLREVRDEFTETALPIDPSLAEVDEKVLAQHTSRLFAKQLEWINVHGRNLKRAMIAYHRAYNQRQRWLEDGDLVDTDLQQFEQRLFEEWETHFEDMCDSLEMAGIATPEKKTQAGRELYQLIRDSSKTLIRENFTEAFLTEGSGHMLADTGVLGWHPEFKERISEVLERIA